jgi:N-acetylglucosamine kinase-like BadF-type ATPase
VARYVLGVDGGNSKTLALVADTNGTVVGLGQAGCANHQATSIEAAMGEIATSVDAALAAAGLNRGDIHAAYFSLAGADLPEDFALLQPALDALALGRVRHVDNDVMAALRSGTDKADAVVVVLGAGSNAGGRNARGESTRFPALGWISGDWGGAGDIAREGIRMAVRAHDGRGDATSLAELLPRALGVANVEEMIRALYFGAISVAQQFAVAPVVLRAAEAGDTVSRAIVTRQGTEAAVMAVTILTRLDLLEAEPDVVLSGGLARANNQVLLDAATDGITRAAPDARIVLPDLHPAAGAVLLAFDLAHLPVTPAIRTELRRTSPAITYDER